MTTRNPSRRFSPSLPSGSNITIALASVAAGIAIGVVVAGQPFQSWGGSEKSELAVSIPAATNIAPGSGITADSIQPSAQERKLSRSGTTGFRDFDPEVRFGSGGLTTRATQPSSAERKLSPTGRQGFQDFDPAVTFPNS